MSGMGVIEGGWGFVWAAYGISAAVLLGYGASVVLRLRSELARAQRDSDRVQQVS